jgi:hypothetical protein
MPQLDFMDQHYPAFYEAWLKAAARVGTNASGLYTKSVLARSAVFYGGLGLWGHAMRCLEAAGTPCYNELHP